MRTYFITGGEGFIGYHICKLLLRNDENHVATYDAQKHYIPFSESLWPIYQLYRIKSLVSDNLTRIRGDVNDRGLLKESLEKYKPDVIIHLAALPVANVSHDYPEEARINILDGTTVLLDILREVNFKFDRFVYTSSSMVYGDFLRDKNGQIIPAHEEQQCNPVGIYGAMKLSGEYVTKVYARRLKFNYTIIRPSAAYGPTDCNKRVTEIFVTNALKGEKLKLDNGGHHMLDFSYVKDVAEGFLLATNSDKAVNQTFNITRGEGRKIRELAQIIADLIPGTKIIDEEAVVFRPNRGTCDISKARRLLGYNPKYSLEEGIKEYIEFIKNTGLKE